MATAILYISDIHRQHRSLHDLPPADIIIHSGDVSEGKGAEVSDFIEWFGKLNYKHKIFVGGNHDRCLDGKNAEGIQSFLPDNMYYPCDSGVEIEGVRFWGIPYFISYELRAEKHQRSLSAKSARATTCSDTSTTPMA
ncbi:MAG: metallophosphoesterase [Tannerella sp.]|jgi:predicted phosphodiesterase|nr:metallophosphoesterase [Tannerella sp.]